MKIFLIGYMGSGKTTIGRPLANKLGMQFVDTDSVIESIEGRSVSSIFADKGELYFRNLEKKVLLDLIDKDNVVVSTGGGMPCFENNMDMMNQQGVTIYLKLSAGALLDRLKPNRETRPLIAGKNDEQLLEFITSALEPREKCYSKAKITVSGLSLNADKLINELKLNKYISEV